MKTVTFLAALLVLASPIVPAAAQTGARADAQAGPAGPARFACRANLTHLRVSIPPWEEARPWFAGLLGGRAPTARQLADRAYCAALLDEAVVRFESDQPPTSTGAQ